MQVADSLSVQQKLTQCSKATMLFFSCSVLSDSFATPGIIAHHTPLSMGFADKNTGVGCHFLLQGIFLTQGSNPWLLLGRQILYHWATWTPKSNDQISRSVVSDSLRPHESQHARPPCPSPTPGVHADSRPSSQWCHPAISSSLLPFSSCPQSLL